MSVFEKLNQIDVGGHIEKKGNLSYLSWAWAWAELKKAYPSSIYTVYENSTGFNYHHDNKTGWVKVGVTVEGIEIIEYLPIMDYRNNSIVVSDITSMDVTKAIQRCATKAIGRHGLGLYIYAGEDLPEKPQLTPEEKAEQERQEQQRKEAEQKRLDDIKFYQTGIKSALEDLIALNVAPKALQNSVKHHLEVDRASKCNDVEKLKAYLMHSQNKIDKIEDELKKEK